MMRQGLYAFGLEPCNSPFGATDELLDAGLAVDARAGRTATYELEFGVVAGDDAVERLATSPHRSDSTRRTRTPT